MSYSGGGRFPWAPYWERQDRVSDINAMFRDADFSLFLTHMRYSSWYVARRIRGE